MPHELVPRYVSHELLEAMETLHEGARQGHIVGITYSVILKGGRRYMNDWAGVVDRMPTYSLGALKVLCRELEDVIHQRDPGDTR